MCWRKRLRTPTGRFQFDDIESRPFRSFGDRSPWDVVALADGFALGWVHLSAGNAERDWTIKLHKAKTIRGRLIDSDDKPVAGCTVQVGNVEAPGSQWHGDFADPLRLDLWRSQLSPNTTTDADGHFELSGLPADKRLTLVAQHPDFVHHYFYVRTTDEPQADVEQTSVREGVQTTEQRPVHASGFTEKLERGGRLRGRVVFSDSGAPVPQAKVSANAQNRHLFELADADGRFEMTGLHLNEGPYKVSSQAEEPGYLAVREQVAFSDDHVLRRSRAAIATRRTGARKRRGRSNRRRSGWSRRAYIRCDGPRGPIGLVGSKTGNNRRLRTI